jgi:hypothetical protein
LPKRGTADFPASIQATTSLTETEQLHSVILIVPTTSKVRQSTP